MIPAKKLASPSAGAVEFLPHNPFLPPRPTGKNRKPTPHRSDIEINFCNLALVQNNLSALPFPF